MAKAEDPNQLALCLRALLNKPHSREELDRACHASNAPHLVHRLRADFGIEVETTLEPHTAPGGRKSRHAIYGLVGRDRARQLLKQWAADAVGRVVSTNFQDE